MLSLLFGLLSTAGAAALTVAIAFYTSQQFHNVSPSFIPLGAFVLGSLSGAGYFGGLSVSGRRARPIDYIAAALLGVVGYAGVNYAVYRTTYVDENLSINHQFHGRPISQFFADGRRERFTWPVFFVREAQQRRASVGGTTTAVRTLPSPPRRNLPLTTAQRALTGFEFIAFPAGAALIGLLILDRRYCERCRRYLEERDLFCLPLEGLDASIVRLNQAIALDPDAVLALGGRTPTPVEGSHVQISVHHCSGCGSGFLLLRFIRKTMLMGLIEEVRDRQTVRLPGHFAGDLSARAPAPPKST